jgi:hypothetical protein
MFGFIKKTSNDKLSSTGEIIDAIKQKMTTDSFTQDAKAKFAKQNNEYDFEDDLDFDDIKHNLGDSQDEELIEDEIDESDVLDDIDQEDVSVNQSSNQNGTLTDEDIEDYLDEEDDLDEDDEDFLEDDDLEDEDLELEEEESDLEEDSDEQEEIQNANQQDQEDDDLEDEDLELEEEESDLEEDSDEQEEIQNANQQDQEEDDEFEEEIQPAMQNTQQAKSFNSHQSNALNIAPSVTSSIHSTIQNALNAKNFIKQQASVQSRGIEDLKNINMYDLTVSLVKTQLEGWMNENLERIVNSVVEKEIKKLME